MHHRNVFIYTYVYFSVILSNFFIFPSCQYLIVQTTSIINNISIEYINIFPFRMVTKMHLFGQSEGHNCSCNNIRFQSHIINHNSQNPAIGITITQHPTRSSTINHTSSPHPAHHTASSNPQSAATN